MPKLSIILSFYNEAEVLPELLDRLHAALQNVPITYEFIFLNDASTDGSLELLTQRAQIDPCIRIVTLSRNFGRKRIGACTIAGIEFASGDAMVMMDTDLQDPPEVVPQLVQAWLDDPSADVVYTTRNRRAGESRFKMIVTKIGYDILNGLSDVDLPRESGDFRLISRRVAQHLLHLQERRPFIRGLVRWIGFKQKQVFYDRDPRGGGVTHFPLLSNSVIDNFLVGLLSFSDWPLKLVFWVGLLSSSVSIGAFFLTSSLAALGVIGWVAPACTALTSLFAVTWLLLGVLALQLILVFDQARGRPGYIVDSTVGFEQAHKVTEQCRIAAPWISPASTLETAAADTPTASSV